MYQTQQGPQMGYRPQQYGPQQTIGGYYPATTATDPMSSMMSFMMPMMMMFLMIGLIMPMIKPAKD